ncbi:MAG: hypothetical protein GY696_24010, partial [Gammaproteobacteria bacterium]|nr:hypothetical protein [Gammaproteobacteria bacterium]
MNEILVLAIENHPVSDAVVLLVPEVTILGQHPEFSLELQRGLPDALFSVFEISESKDPV